MKTRVRVVSRGFPGRHQGRLRVALYSHDAMGLGHMRRNMLIAESLAASDVGANVLLVSGSHLLNRFPVPDGVDAVTLPAFRKTPSGNYESGGLGIERARLLSLRMGTLKAALVAYRPHVLLVDKRPLGVLGELEPTLRSLRRSGETRIVLGLRDILDDPQAVQDEWGRSSNEAAIARYYDQVWIYGDRNVYDGPKEYGFAPRTVEKVRFTGYLDALVRIRRESVASPDQRSGPLVLCQLGGGQDGERLAMAFSQAALPRGTRGLILTGPFMPNDAVRALQRRASDRDDLEILTFSDRQGGLVDRASRIVSMGGYNTLAEAVALRKPTLVVPRVRPRTEQLIRADCFASFGLVDVLHPERMSPRAISNWLSRDSGPPRGAAGRIDFGGLARLPGLIADLLDAPSDARPTAARKRAAAAGTRDVAGLSSVGRTSA